jgi:hypothetical protein
MASSDAKDSVEMISIAARPAVNLDFFIGISFEARRMGRFFRYNLSWNHAFCCLFSDSILPSAFQQFLTYALGFSLWSVRCQTELGNRAGNWQLRRT